MPVYITGDENDPRTPVVGRPGFENRRRVKYMLHSVDHDGPVPFDHIHDAFYPQQIRALQQHDQVEPLLDDIQANWLVVGYAERANIIVVAINVVPALIGAGVIGAGVIVARAVVRFPSIGRRTVSPPSR